MHTGVLQKDKKPSNFEQMHLKTNVGYLLIYCIGRDANITVYVTLCSDIFAIASYVLLPTMKLLVVSIKGHVIFSFCHTVVSVSKTATETARPNVLSDYYINLPEN